MLAAARFVSLDTSHWEGLCGSLIEPRSRADAACRLMTLAGDGWIPATSFHQIQELLAHGDERIAIARLSAIRRIPTLAVVIGSDVLPGTVLDIQRLELIAATSDPSADAEAVRAKVRSAFLQMTTGEAMVESIMPFAHVVREHSVVQQERGRETASISQATTLDQSRTSFYLNGIARSAQDIDIRFSALKATLAEELTRRGDARLSDPQSSAAKFIESLAMQKDTICAHPHPVVEILKAAGLTVEDVADFENLGQVGELAHFRRCIETSSKGTGLSAVDLRNISQDRVPTWLVHRALHRHRQVRPRVEGGDLTDGHLLSLAPYFDCTSVDKRTAEDARRIRQHDSTAGPWLTHVRKASSWSDALNNLPN